MKNVLFLSFAAILFFAWIVDAFLLDKPAADALASAAAKQASQRNDKTTKTRSRRTVEQVISIYGAQARRRMKPWFHAQKVPYPPRELTIVGLKDEKIMMLFAPDKDGQMKKVLTYQILAASGEAGPKLKQGDFQVPEGFYKIELLNPNSSYHLSLKLNYPNSEDRKNAQAEGRTNLGGDIMIHGSNVSIGCIALGDEAIEEVFVLVHDVGHERVDVILAPQNLSEKDAGIDFSKQPEWLPQLYKRLKISLQRLPF